MRRLLLSTLTLLSGVLGIRAQVTLDSICTMLENAPVQEKVYLHLDNTCYFKGDTIWYKAYVVRADDLSYTDMSHILYVELVSPDGLVVERQNLIVTDEGYGNGNFELRDSLYSGYYELRAYTRWMMNFCVTEHPYGRKDYELFYNRRMARDFFRQYGTVYSRVIPVYERPDSLGDYAQKYIVSRPKTRIEKDLKEKLTVRFYPEGGHLIVGEPCTVAFEALNEEGEQIDIAGEVQTDGAPLAIQTKHQGRGQFTVTAADTKRLSTSFTYLGKDYHFDLPKAEARGCALHLAEQGDEVVADIVLKGLPAAEYGVAVLCRGVMKKFLQLQPDASGRSRVTISKTELPTGVNDLIVIDGEGRPLADRLFFVDNHDYGQQTISVEGRQFQYEPFEQVTLDFQAPADAKHLSIAVRDGATDEPTYDTGNMMTELLLSSDLRGFIAHPDYYFESADETHRQSLDLLMMVQGWRRYDYQAITASDSLRYKPEKNITVEGAVYKTVSYEDYEPDEVAYWLQGRFGYSERKAELPENNDLQQMGDSEDGEDGVNSPEMEATPMIDPDPYFGVDNRGLGYEVTLNGELVVGSELATVEMETTNGGRFSFNVPPYYGEGILFLSAHKTDISENKQKRLRNKGVLDEKAWPEFYVKRDLFFPVFAKKYDYYQCHQPADSLTLADNGQLVPTIERISKFDAELRNINVEARRRRGRRAIDYDKPACVYDTYELYNLATDYGLSFGRFRMDRFPVQVATLLLGNYNSNRHLNVQARMSDNLKTPYIFYRNYTPAATIDTNAYRSDYAIYDNLSLSRQSEVRLFTDFELRNEDRRPNQEQQIADVTLDLVLMPDDSKRYTYRDRRIILPGMYAPDDFYCPDYSQRPLADEVKDYRRTLYWNPNAPLDEEGRFTAIFYNNGKTTRIRVDAAGLTAQGQPLTIAK